MTHKPSIWKCQNFAGGDAIERVCHFLQSLSEKAAASAKIAIAFDNRYRVFYLSED